MYGHLDDPGPPPAPELGQVLARAARYRRRRRARATLAASLALAVAAAVAAGVVLDGRALPSRLDAHEIAYQYRQRPDPLPAGTAVPTTALAGVVFVGADAGFAMAVHRDNVLLAATSDGGADWHVVDPRLPVAYAQGAQGEIEFTDLQHGYLWHGAAGSAPTAPLWVTSDGGGHWQRAPIGPVVFDVSAIGADVWAVVGTCPATGATTGAPSSGTSASGAPCSLALEASVDYGAQWQEVPGTIPSAPADTRAADRDVELARITTTRAYVLSEVRPGGSPPVLTYTDDRGATWVTRPVPCTGPADLGAELAASGTDDLWLFCGGQGSGGAQDKALYRSADGGIVWVLTAAASGSGGAVTTAPGIGTLPVAGYLAPFSIGHLNLAVVSPSTAWLFPDRGQAVLTTGDGGSTWQPVTGVQSPDLGSGTPGNLTFISPTQGWVCELGVGLWRTTDGTDWERLGG